MNPLASVLTALFLGGGMIQFSGHDYPEARSQLWEELGLCKGVWCEHQDDSRECRERMARGMPCIDFNKPDKWPAPVNIGVVSA
jgi:hypothetical protein